MTLEIMLATIVDQKLRNRRKLRRYNYRSKVSFTIGGSTYRGLSSNFSLSGLFISSRHEFPPGTLLDIAIHFHDDLVSRIRGKVVRASRDIPVGRSETTVVKYRKGGMGIEILQKDCLYLHFTRWFLSSRGQGAFGEFISYEREQEYLETRSELQENCQLFDVVALLIGERSKQTEFLGRAWFEAKITNNTDYFLTEPIVVFLTVADTQYVQNKTGKGLPEIGTMLISSSDNISCWKPGETILLESDVDSLSKEVPPYELKFLDFLANIVGIAVDEPVNIDAYVATLWIGAPCLVSDSQVAEGASSQTT